LALPTAGNKRAAVNAAAISDRRMARSLRKVQ
jgi:hypothetical protein